MRNKSLLIGTLVLGLGALALLNLKPQDAADSGPKSPLVATEILTQPKSLTLKANGKSTTVEKAADGNWVVKEKFNLPVDVENRLRPLVIALQKAENLGVLTSNPKRLEKLGLTDSSLSVTGENGKVFAAEIGKPTDDGVGLSMRLQGETSAIRTSFNGYLEADPTNWMDSVLFNGKPEDIKAISFTWADGQQTFARPEKGKPFGGKEGPTVEDIVNALAIMRASDAAAKGDKEAAAAFAKFWTVKLELFDGATVTAVFAKGPASAPNEQPKLFTRVSHSDPKHVSNVMGAKAEFLSQPWLSEQLPASLAEFKRRVSPPAENPGQPGAPQLGNFQGLSLPGGNAPVLTPPPAK